MIKSIVIAILLGIATFVCTLFMCLMLFIVVGIAVADETVVKKETLSDKREVSTTTVRVARPLEEDRSSSVNKLPDWYTPVLKRESPFKELLEKEKDPE